MLNWAFEIKDLGFGIGGSRLGIGEKTEIGWIDWNILKIGWTRLE